LGLSADTGAQALETALTDDTHVGRAQVEFAGQLRGRGIVIESQEHYGAFPIRKTLEAESNIKSNHRSAP